MTVTLHCGLTYYTNFRSKVRWKENFWSKGNRDTFRCTLVYIKVYPWNVIYGLCIPVYSFDLRCYPLILGVKVLHMHIHNYSTKNLFFYNNLELHTMKQFRAFYKITEVTLTLVHWLPLLPACTSHVQNHPW